MDGEKISAEYSYEKAQRKNGKKISIIINQILISKSVMSSRDYFWHENCYFSPLCFSILELLISMMSVYIVISL